jgi:glycosyltransferase involved in cell wall biosynthesis
LKSIGGNPFEESLRAAGVPVHALEARNLRDLSAFRRLRRLLAERRIDVVHAHLAYASIWALLAAGRGGRTVPVVTTLHVRPPAAGLLSREGARRRLRVALSNRRAARVIAVSEAVRRAWVEEAGLDSARAEVVHNGIDVGAFELSPGNRESARAELRRELGVAPGALLVLTVSVLRQGKGLEVLIDAAGRVSIGSPAPEVRVVVVGDGPAAGALRERAAAGEGRVLFTGFRSDVARLLAAADLFVLPTLDDAFPTVLLEAMAAGLPVIASDTGGVPEIVSARGRESTGETGRLVPPGDRAALATAIAELLADAPRRLALGEAGRRRARERFSSDAWLDRLERVYAEALTGRAGEAR